jgi:SAM-dependent methyltransferase
VPAACPICANTAGNALLAQVPERQFGLGESFDYLHCAGCGALSLLGAPGDMARFYPASYYSLAPVDLAGSGRVKQTLKRLRTAVALRQHGLARQIAPLWLQQLSGLGLTLDSAVLDVGCGNGARLAVMRAAGCSNLQGVDPYLDQPVDMPGLRLERSELSQVRGAYQLIMLHHSFEHLAEPGAVLRQVRGLLTADGVLLIRTPLADSVAFQRYGRDWAQLDAPRHVHIHTRASIALLGQQAGLELARVECDSTAFQFWGSEQARRGIQLESPRSWLRQPDASPFSREQIAQWEAEARQLNAQGQGDQAALYLRPVALPKLA